MWGRLLEWWNGIVELNVECVLQGESVCSCWESCFLLSFKDHIQDLGGIEAEPFNCCCGYLLSCLNI